MSMTPEQKKGLAESMPEAFAAVGNYLDGVHLSLMEKQRANRLLSSTGMVSQQLSADLTGIERNSRVTAARMIAHDAAHNIDLSGSSLTRLRYQMREFEYDKIMTTVNADLRKSEIMYQADMMRANARVQRGNANAALISGLGSALMSYGIKAA